MKRKCGNHPLVLGSLLLAVSLLSLQAQGTFQNLDFEAAKVAGYSPGSYGISSTNAFPGWIIYFGSPNAGTNGGVGPVGYDEISLGSASISIDDTNSNFGLNPLQGKFSASLNGDIPNPPPINSTFAALGQTGQVPTNAASLLFWASSLTGLKASFGGTSIPLTEVGFTADYFILSGDISAFAGQTGELRFTAFPNQSSFLDNIQFSPSPIPEPTTFALAALGALILGHRRKSSKG